MEYNRREILKAFEDNKEYIKKASADGIRNNRMGKCSIRITDNNGIPLPNVPLHIEQKSHNFKYGANIFMLDEFETEEKNLQYRKNFKEICNMATLPFYWNELEPEEGKPRFAENSPRIYRRPAIDLCMKYCNENNIEPKEHCLFYEPYTPEWVDVTDINSMKKKYEKRIQTLAERYRDRIRCWEVTNETLYFFKDASVMYTAPDLIEWCFDCASRYFPDNELLINDAHCNIWNVFNENRSQYYMQIERALSKNARIDGIGMQFHMFYSREDEKKETELFYNPMHLYRVLNRYADFKKPIQLTEITIPAYSTNEDDEQIQAEIIRNLYTIWFGYPNVEAIMYWTLVDGYAAFAPQGDMSVGENYYYGGLMRFDMSPKPAYYVIRDLFIKEWHTDVRIATDENGMAEFEGFYGCYDVAVFSNEKFQRKIELKKDGENRFELAV